MTINLFSEILKIIVPIEKIMVRLPGKDHVTLLFCSK